MVQLPVLLLELPRIRGRWRRRLTGQVAASTAAGSGYGGSRRRAHDRTDLRAGELSTSAKSTAIRKATGNASRAFPMPASGNDPNTFPRLPERDPGCGYSAAATSSQSEFVSMASGPAGAGGVGSKSLGTPFGRPARSVVPGPFAITKSIALVGVGGTSARTPHRRRRR